MEIPICLLLKFPIVVAMPLPQWDASVLAFCRRRVQISGHCCGWSVMNHQKWWFSHEHNGCIIGYTYTIYIYIFILKGHSVCQTQINLYKHTIMLHCPYDATYCSSPGVRSLPTKMPEEVPLSKRCLIRSCFTSVNAWWTLHWAFF